ncbi:hypothetical protein M408DRAFT_74807 [Serendipita vermifera MAFF 305830]|uniref:Alcohol dehydrogenase-like N-terminal domain-containing protein n=1 Tax=Serendipita vermifera MAFF 305830 TaxID=933852 RepID=A0A0C3B125_SERVB|nr:hypothetical protein M408DRAFT_74807 [Serendipita vermifera MAFF 305830]
MGVFQTIFNQPSRSYAPTEASTPPAAATAPEVDKESQQRAERRAQYYSAAADPRLRKEWDHILQQEQRSRRPKRPPSAKQVVPVSLGGVSQPLQSLNGLPKTLHNRTKDEEDNDEFYTPFSSPQASPRTPALDLSVTHSVIPMQSLSLAAAEHDRNHSRSSSLNSASSFASTSEDNYTNYSWSEGHGSQDTQLTRVSSRASRHSKQRSESSVNPSSSEWGNEIRWLVPPETTPPVPAPRRAHTISAPSTTSLSSSQSHGSRSSGRSSSRSGRSKTEPVRPRPKRRMSEIQEEHEDDVIRSSMDEAEPAAAADANNKQQPQVTAFGVLTPQRRKSQSDRTRSQPKKKSLGALSETSSTSSSTRTADLPLLVPHAEPTTYTSLVFPRSNYQPAKHPDRLTGSVNVVQLGVASTTMTTISITKGAAETLNRNRKFSFPITLSTPRNSAEMPSHLASHETPIVSLTSHTPTPSKVQTNQVLVQVWCVALEGLDVLLTREKSKNADGYGFVPGRGFCGRVVEAGYGVSNLRKGDWVMGLLEVAKSGALSEFVVIEKRRITRCPAPTSSLTAEHLAVLAVCGVAAYRATSTLPGPHKDSRILVLQAHDGTGALVAQQLVAAGARVTVQIASADVMEALRGLKLEAVKIGAPLAVLRALGEQDEDGLGAFDAVVDTVGGKEIWESCKAVFGVMGQFTTIVGDSADAVMSRNAHVKSNMRSLRRAFTKSDNRFIGYEWVSPSNEVDHEGKDIRDSLASACALATEGLVRPRIAENLIVPFERAPDILNGWGGQSAAASLLQGAVAVVRLQ